MGLIVWVRVARDVPERFGIVRRRGSTLQTKDKAWSDGWFSNIPVAQGRSISVEGHIIGKCTENCINAWDAFKRSFNITSQSLVVQLGNISRQVQVMQSSSAPLVEWAGVNIMNSVSG